MAIREKIDHSTKNLAGMRWTMDTLLIEFLFLGIVQECGVSNSLLDGKYSRNCLPVFNFWFLLSEYKYRDQL